jgi:hypothetical protein
MATPGNRIASAAQNNRAAAATQGSGERERPITEPAEVLACTMPPS